MQTSIKQTMDQVSRKEINDIGNQMSKCRMKRANYIDLEIPVFIEPISTVNVKNSIERYDSYRSLSVSSLSG